ncbi:MAG: segregation/condensation protein A [Deltaproteobacteria bacterium]|jgi:segregation and condensation protein A|nr:segregation/condensation protein A [Deltaproteobacteria bacterium]MBW2500643.1 segregation/condensation protein A [Deltaproteobacteria bacterium]
MNAAESTPADSDPSSGNILDDLGADPDERTDGLAGYAVKLSVFEGPLDLLLHLIRQNEVEITDIPISRIAEQYLETIELMQELNLDVAAEYLVMAATLALIKSRMLLPVESEDDEEGSDPRADLVQRLLEYQRFKEAAEALSRRRLLGRDVFDVHGPGPERTPDSEREIAVELFDLVAAFKEVLESADSRVLSHEVETEPVTVRDRMVVVMELLERSESVEFMQIFLSVDGEGLPSRSVLVATFLAILELARLTAIRIYQGLNEQGTPEGPIRVRRVATSAGASDWLERVTETM